MQQPSPKRQAPPCPFSKRFPSELRKDDAYFMQLAFNEALDAWKEDEVPIGAVISIGDQLVARAHNRRDSLRDPTAHAEILAITQAANALGDWRLNAATLYVTKEPCPMCAGASVMARLGRIVFALGDPKMGCLGGATDLNQLPASNHRCRIEQGLMERESRELIQAYFQLKRQSPPPRLHSGNAPGEAPDAFQ
ncbi:MAG: nucleoside deaminase [Opitutales bacterium]